MLLSHKVINKGGYMLLSHKLIRGDTALSCDVIGGYTHFCYTRS